MSSASSRWRSAEVRYGGSADDRAGAAARGNAGPRSTPASAPASRQPEPPPPKPESRNAANRATAAVGSAKARADSDEDSASTANRTRVIPAARSAPRVIPAASSRGRDGVLRHARGVPLRDTSSTRLRAGSSGRSQSGGSQRPASARAATAGRGSENAAPARSARAQTATEPRISERVVKQVVADAVRMLDWGSEWPQLAGLIARLADRPGEKDVWRILREHRATIESRSRPRHARVDPAPRWPQSRGSSATDRDANGAAADGRTERRSQ